MVDAAVSVVIEKLADLLAHEAGFLGDVEGDVVRLQNELKRMRCFLKDADAKQGQDARVTNWINEIRDVAYDAEDVVDDYLLKSLAYSSKTGIRGLLSKLTWPFTRAPSLHKAGNQINSIWTSIRDISNAMQTYRIKFTPEDGCESSNSARRTQQLRRVYTHKEGEHVIIGLKESTRNVMNELMKEESNLCVVSIVGMGGLGKSTLARKVYKHADVRRRFNCFSWSCISQQFSKKDVLRGILKEVTDADLRDMTEDELVKTLYHGLEEKRYLIVLDDIWKTDVWDFLKDAFPNGRSGSKVLFTTRNKAVALYADPRSCPIELPFLTKKEGWELLQARAFSRGFTDNHGSLAEFETIGNEIVDKCGGLPLAIVVLGGLLATKESLHQWKVVRENIGRQLSKLEEQDRTGVYNILALSYQELPSHLKPCFLYLSQFPEDFEIRKGPLIRMWIAEGFIPYYQNSKNEETMEDVGEQYLEELISRCMVQVIEKDCTGRGVKSCRIHDLMRDFCVRKAAEESFLTVIEYYGDKDTKNSSSTTQSGSVSKPRRIAIHGENISNFNCQIAEGDSHLRSLLCFLVWDIELDKLNFIFKNFRLLRVLSFGDARHERKISKEIGNLFQLRYFRLLGGVVLQTKFIRNLKNLLTLDLRWSSKLDVDALWKFERLRYFRGMLKEDCRVDTLTQLVTLKYVFAKSFIKNDAMLKLTNLRNLGILFQTKEEFEVIMRSPIFSSDGFLRSLDMSKGEYGVSLLEQLSHCHHLVKLTLRGAILEEEIHCHPHSLEFLPKNICKLTLTDSKLRLQDPMGILEKLPELRYLELVNAYSGCKMVCSAYGFPKLEFLYLGYLVNLEEWIVEENAMPCLDALWMSKLRMLKRIPNGLKFLKNLQTLSLLGLNKEVVDKIRVVDGIEGDEFNVVRHIPTIHIYGC